MSEPIERLSFEYCALRVLMQWTQAETRLHEKIKRNASAEEIRESLRHFRVAWNFPGLREDEKARLIGVALRRISRDRKLSLREKVPLLACELQKYFRTFNLSAASKLLWLRHRAPFIIYDSRTLKALQKLECRFHDTRNYPEFCRHWRSRYRTHRKAISKACGHLVTIRTWLPAHFESRHELSKLLSRRWFHERVFDMYLWDLGGDEPATG